MRCRKCGEKAVINMRQHRLSLCKQHYLEWLPNHVLKFIEKNEMCSDHDRVLVAVSGGKDSLALWDILWKLGFHTEGFYINLGINGEIAYSNRSMKFAQEFADQRNLTIHIVDIKRDYGESIPEISVRTRRGRDKPCSLCGLIKRHIMNRFALDGHYDVLVTAHNLDDEAQTIMMNVMRGDSQRIVRTNRPRDKPVEGLISRIKPLLELSERDIVAYSHHLELPYHDVPCPYYREAMRNDLRDFLNEMEHKRPGTLLAILRSGEAITASLEANTHTFQSERCEKCREVASGRICKVCRLMDELLQGKAAAD